MSPRLLRLTMQIVMAPVDVPDTAAMIRQGYYRRRTWRRRPGLYYQGRRVV